MQKENIFVTIIDDDKGYCEVVGLLLQNTPGFDVLSSYPSCESALNKIINDNPDVILLDINFPEGYISGIDGVKKLRKLLPETPIIMLTDYAQNEYIFDSLRNGALGYLVKNCDKNEIPRSITDVYNGGSPMSSSIARQVVEFFRRNPPPDPLTDRQMQVLQKLCEGKNNRAIAEELFISVPGVKDHIRKIYRALHVTNRVRAALVAREWGLG